MQQSKRLYCLFMLLLCSVNFAALAQVSPVEWGYHLRSLFTQGVDIEIADNGDVITLGNFANSLVEVTPFGPQNSNTYTVPGSQEGYFLSATSQSCPLGLQWKSGASSTDELQAETMTRDASGNLYIGGKFKGTADFDIDHVAPNDQRTAPYLSLFMARYSPTGEFEDVIVLVGQDSDGSGTLADIAVDPSGNVVLAGSFLRDFDFDPGTSSHIFSNGLFYTDGFLARYLYNSGSGSYTLHYANQISNGNPSVATSVVTAANGQAWVTGHFSGLTNFGTMGSGPVNLSNTGPSDIFLASYDKDGTVLFAQKYGHDFHDGGAALVMHPNGDTLFLGAHVIGYSADYEGTNVIIPEEADEAYRQRAWIVSSHSPSTGDVSAARVVAVNYQALGSPISWFPEGINDMCIDHSGVNLYLTGSYGDDFTIYHPGQNVFQQNIFHRASTVIRCTVEDNRAPNWSIFTDGNPFGVDYKGIAVDAMGKAYVTGDHNGNGPGSLDHQQTAICPDGQDYCNHSLCTNFTGLIAAKYAPVDASPCQNTNVVPTNLSATRLSASTNTFRLNWSSAPAGAAVWQVEYWMLPGQKTSFTIYGVPPITRSLNSSIGNLLNWRVRRVCGLNNTSPWSAVSSWVKPRKWAGEELVGEVPEMVVSSIPAEQFLQVRFAEAMPREVMLYDLSGKRLFERKIKSNEVKIDVKAFSAGTYLLKVASANDVAIQKVTVR